MIEFEIAHSATVESAHFWYRFAKLWPFTIAIRGFTILMTGVEFQGQNSLKYAGNMEVPNSEYFGMGFYRSIEASPDEIQQDSRLQTTAIMFLLVMKKEILAFMTQILIEIEKFLERETQSWNNVEQLTESVLKIFHQKIRDQMLKATEIQREDLLEELAKNILDPKYEVDSPNVENQ